MSSSIYEVLEPILTNTYNPEKASRDKAEADLKSFLPLPNSFTGFLGICAIPTICNDVKMAAALTLKNNARKYWQRDGSAEFPMTEDEKTAAKDSLLDMMIVETCNPLRSLMAEVMKAIVEHEFEDNRWPALVPTLVNHLQSTNQLAVFNSLIALRKLVKFFEYKKDEQRRPLNDIIIAAFPTIQGLCSSIHGHNNAEVGMVYNQVFKIFWSCMMYRLPSADTTVACDINFWLQLMSFVLEKQLPAPGETDGQPANPDDRPVYPWWKAKKWAVRIILRFMSRYGNPRFASDEDTAFASYFNKNIAPILLSPIMNTLASISRGDYVTEVVHRECLEFMSVAVQMASTYKFIKEHIDFVMFTVIMPTLSLSQKDVSLFTEDPIEFVRKVHDVMEEWRDPRISATNLLETLVRKRSKDSLGRLLAWMEQSLAEYNAEPEIIKRDHRVKDSIMVAMATISTKLMKNKTYKSTVVPFLEKHVIPEFISPIPFLRSRACWMIESFERMKWDSAECGSLLHRVVPGLLNGLRDQCLPVQAAAACSMRAIVSAEAAKPLLGPIIPDIVTEYFRILNDVENEAMLEALGIIVQNFTEEIVPLAPTMISNLGTAFLRLSSMGTEDDEAAFGASQCLDTMYAIVEALDPESGGDLGQMRAVEAMMMPILVKTVATKDSFEYLENVVEFITAFTYYGADISPNMWSLCGPLLESLESWAFDYISEIMTPLLNFMSKDIATFASLSHNGVPVVQLLLRVIDKTLTIDDSNRELESKCAANLLKCLVVTAKPYSSSMSTIWSSIFQMVMKRLTTNVKSGGLQTKLLECVLGMMYSDIRLTLAMFADPINAAYTGAFWDQLFIRLPCMDKSESQRLVVLAFSSLLSAPPENLPPVVQSNINSIFVQTLREISLLKDSNEDVALRFDEDEEHDDEDEDEGVGFGIAEDEDEDEDEQHGAEEDENDGGGEVNDVEDTEDKSYYDFINGKGTKYMDGEPVDDEEEDGLEFTSPLDNIDVLTNFVGVLQSINATNPAYGQALSTGLSGDDANLVNSFLATAQQREAS